MKTNVQPTSISPSAHGSASHFKLFNSNPLHLSSARSRPLRFPSKCIRALLSGSLFIGSLTTGPCFAETVEGEWQWVGSKLIFMPKASSPQKTSTSTPSDQNNSSQGKEGAEMKGRTSQRSDITQSSDIAQANETQRTFDPYLSRTPRTPVSLVQRNRLKKPKAIDPEKLKPSFQPDGSLPEPKPFKPSLDAFPELEIKAENEGLKAEEIRDWGKRLQLRSKALKAIHAELKKSKQPDPLTLRNYFIESAELREELADYRQSIDIYQKQQR